MAATSISRKRLNLQTAEGTSPAILFQAAALPAGRLVLATVPCEQRRQFGHRQALGETQHSQQLPSHPLLPPTGRCSSREAAVGMT